MSDDKKIFEPDEIDRMINEVDDETSEDSESPMDIMYDTNEKVTKLCDFMFSNSTQYAKGVDDTLQMLLKNKNINDETAMKVKAKVLGKAKSGDK